MKCSQKYMVCEGWKGGREVLVYSFFFLFFLNSVNICMHMNFVIDPWLDKEENFVIFSGLTVVLCKLMAYFLCTVIIKHYFAY